MEKRYPSGLGIALVIQMLRGSKGQRVLRLGLDHLSTYGIMRGIDQQTIRSYIDHLISEGYLEQTDGEYPVLRRTVRSSDVLFHGAQVTLKEKQIGRWERASGSRLSKSEIRPADGTAEDGLFQMLRDLRMQLAQKEGVPAYIVFSNAALLDMAARRPRSMAEFLAVSGVGQVKARRYGAQFLRAFRFWAVQVTVSAEARALIPLVPNGRGESFGLLDRCMAGWHRFWRRGMFQVVNTTGQNQQGACDDIPGDGFRED